MATKAKKNATKNRSANARLSKGNPLETDTKVEQANESLKKHAAQSGRNQFLRIAPRATRG